MSPGKRANLRNTEDAKRVFRNFLEHEIATSFRKINPEVESPQTPEVDLGELDFPAAVPGLRVLPLEDDQMAVLDVEEDHFAVELTSDPPKNKRSLQSSTLVSNHDNQQEVLSPTSSFSSVSTVLRGHNDLETDNFLPSKRAKRKRIIFCCVG